jgi:CheY-like chemotaxis protein
LIVDSNAGSRQLIADMLIAKHVKTVQADKASIAIALIEKQAFDVAFVNYNMPEINGIEMIRQVRQLAGPTTKTLKIILLCTVFEVEQFSLNSQSLGIYNYLLRPVRLYELFKSISNAQVQHEEKVITDLPQAMQRANLTLKVLIAEDNMVNKIFTRTIIERLLPAATIYEASNGQEAVDCCARTVPDLVLLDVQMPEMNGIEACKQIRQQEAMQNKPVIALTAGNVKGDREICIQAGMNDFLVKPFVANDLDMILKKWVFTLPQE